MNIAMSAHDSKIELLTQFCIAYKGILSSCGLSATWTTANVISDTTGLTIRKFLSGSQGGIQQLASCISCNEVDLFLFFRDTYNSEPNSAEMDILRLCDMHNIPFATNLATAEALIHALEAGDLDWRNLK